MVSQNICLWRLAGLNLGRVRGPWEVDSTLKGAYKISHAPGPRAEAIIWKQPGSEAAADLGEPPREARGSWTHPGDTDTGGSHFAELHRPCGHQCSVQFSRSVVSDSLWPYESQHARPPCPSSTPRVHSDSRPSSQWCHPAISSSVVPFFSCPRVPPVLASAILESSLQLTSTSAQTCPSACRQWY